MNKKKILIVIIGLITISSIIFQACKKKEEVDNVKPSVSILSPATGSEFNEGATVNIKVDATDDKEVRKVYFYIDGEIRSTDNSAPYEYSWNTVGKVGTHTLKAEAEDPSNNKGVSSVVNITVKAIEENTPPVANFTVSPEQGTLNTDFAFNASSSTDQQDPTSDLEVRWDWNGDGGWDTQWTTEKTVTHKYIENGTYTAKLEVRDTEGLTNVTTKTVIVTEEGNTAPTAVFTVDPTTGNLSTIFTFNASGCSDLQDPTSQLKVRWDWDGDGNFDTSWETDKTKTHQYSETGNYTVKMEVKDLGGLISNTTKSIVINTETNTPPHAIFTVDPLEGTVNTVFNFDASASTDNQDPSSSLLVRWDWESDGNWDTDWDTDKTKGHQYPIEGVYTAQMEVKDSGGLTDMTSKTVTVDNNSGNTPPNALFNVTPLTGTTATIFGFDASFSTDNEDPTSLLLIRWDWEDDGIWDTDWSASKEENHQYSTEGSYTIKLEVKDTGGLTDSDEKTITVDNSNIMNVPCPGIETVEYGGQVYNTVQIGQQCWMRENLNIGTMIMSGVLPEDNGVIEKFCYDNNPSKCQDYGGLYIWDELMQYTTMGGTQGICPPGWHIPTLDELEDVSDFLGGPGESGGKMKEEGTNHWDPPNEGATNVSGFTALAGGQKNRSTSHTFNYLGVMGNFWTSSQYSNSKAKMFYFRYNSDNTIINSDVYKNYPYSVRCLKN